VLRISHHWLANWLCFFALKNHAIPPIHLPIKSLHQFGLIPNWLCFFKKGRFVENILYLSNPLWVACLAVADTATGNPRTSPGANRNSNYFCVLIFAFYFFAYPPYATRYTLLSIVPRNPLNAIKIPVFKQKIPFLEKMLLTPFTARELTKKSLNKSPVIWYYKYI